jgi:hypothetical protein
MAINLLSSVPFKVLLVSVDFSWTSVALLELLVCSSTFSFLVLLILSIAFFLLTSPAPDGEATS